MDGLNPTRDPNRSSWNSYDTVNTPNPIEQKTEEGSESLIEMQPYSSLSHRQSFHQINSNEDQPTHDVDSLQSKNQQHPQSPLVQPVEQTEQAKPSLFQRFKASLPLFSQFRKTIKASIALLIAVIFIFASATRKATGDSVLLIAIVVIFYFPVRTIGIQTEAVILGTLGALIASAWSFLASYLASLARDKSDPNPVQPGACAVLAVFLFIGTFAVNLVRMKVPKANFATVNACIVLTFTMTYSAGYAPFVPSVTWLFLRPIAIAGAISLAVNYFIWPDDSINNFLGITRRTLGGYNAFFKEHSDAFLSSSLAAKSSTLPSLNARLQNGILPMIDCKHAVKREVLYSRISDVDCSKLSKTIMEMRTSLHGIGLSLIMKNTFISSESKNMYFQKFNDPVIMDAFISAIAGIRPICTELTDLCYMATNEASGRIGDLHYHPRTTLNSILWPFPRLWVSKPTMSDDQQQQQQKPKVTSSQITQMIYCFDEMSKSSEIFKKFLEMNAADIPRNGPLYLIFLYIYNLKQHATKIKNLLELIEQLEIEREKPRLWLPHETIKKWLLTNTNVGTSVGDDSNDYENQNAGNDLARVSTRIEDQAESEDDDIFEVKVHPKKKGGLGDPDVSAPVTPTQKFFYGLYRFEKWLTNTTTFFAFKTAVGVVMMAIPAWRPQDHMWYLEWRGQWAMITLVLWMFPMTGAFIFGLIDRVAGSVVGAILGIVVWEMCRGNPYAMAVVCFIVFLPMYHIFFFVPKYRVASLMSSITMLLVLAYEYGYVVTGTENHDQVYTVAGKRLLLVVIGIVASGILLAIPFPPTSRVELRKRLSCTIRDIGRCFGILSASAMTSTGKKATPAIASAFGKLAMGLRRQIAEEHTLFRHTVYEPPLRGYFPSASYKTLVEKMDNMADLVISMGYSLREVRPEWRKKIASILMQERKEYLSSILTNLKLVSTTLAAKTALPPYMISPLESRQRFVNLLEKKIMIEPKDIADPSFASYSAYLMNSLVFVDELQAVLIVTEDLVGIEDPEEWILSRA